MKRFLLFGLCIAFMAVLTIGLHSRSHASEDLKTIEEKIADYCQSTIDNEMREGWSDYLKDEYGLAIEKSETKFKGNLFKKINDDLMIVIGDLNISFVCADKSKKARRFTRDVFAAFYFDLKNMEVSKTAMLNKIDRIDDEPLKI